MKDGGSSCNDLEGARGAFLVCEYVVVGLGYVVLENKTLPIPRKAGGIGLAGAVTLPSCPDPTAGVWGL